MPSLEQAIYSVGIVGSLYLVYRLLWVVWVRLLRPATSWKSFRGEWALVTGASQGIGKCIAIELARRGLNVILLARSAEKLRAAEQEISKKFPSIRTLVISADLTGDAAVYERIKAEIQPRVVSVLVANAGGYDSGLVNFKEFINTTPEEEDSICKLNFYSTSRCIRLVLPSMLATRKGRIITLSTNGVWTPYGLSLYGSAKAQIMKLTEAIQCEVFQSGVQIQCAMPGVVSTSLVSNEPPSLLFCCTPERFAKDCIDLFSAESAPYYTPYWGHEFLAFMVKTLPAAILHPMNKLGARVVERGVLSRAQKQK